MINAIDRQKIRRPVRKSVQRLRWFTILFHEQKEQASIRTGNVYNIEKSILSKAFANWLRDFEAQKPKRQEDKLAYVGFAAGLMLRQLVVNDPASIDAVPENADLSNPAYFWPEGYLYVYFCLHVRGLVVEQDFLGRQSLSTELDNIRVWWSFRENVRDDPSLAIPFLELFAGEKPKWEIPSLFLGGHARQIAANAKNLQGSGELGRKSAR